MRRHSTSDAHPTSVGRRARPHYDRSCLETGDRDTIASPRGCRVITVPSGGFTSRVVAIPIVRSGRPQAWTATPSLPYQRSSGTGAFSADTQTAGAGTRIASATTDAGRVPGSYIGRAGAAGLKKSRRSDNWLSPLAALRFYVAYWPRYPLAGSPVGVWRGHDGPWPVVPPLERCLDVSSAAVGYSANETVVDLPSTQVPSGFCV